MPEEAPLAVAPGTVRLRVSDKNAEARLVKLLKRVDETTERIKIGNPGDVLLDADGMLQGRFTLSTVALGQLCSCVVPYLSYAISNISGMRRKDDPELSEENFSRDLAIQWLNAAIRLRFVKLKDRSLIVDHRKKRVEGLVGRMYAFLPNSDLYERAKTLINRQLKQMQFAEAVLSGRRMLLRFRDEEPIFWLPGANREAFLGGLYFSNSEVGECSVRASAALIRQRGDNEAISPFLEGGKLTHLQGPQFEKRFLELLDRVRAKLRVAKNLKKNVNSLRSDRLKLGGSKKQHESRATTIKTRLAKKGLPQELIDKIFARMLYYGSYRDDRLRQSMNPLSEYRQRNAYDLFNAITYEAKKCTPGIREVAEQLAYQLVTGKLHLS